MVSFRQSKKVKSVHGIIDQRCLLPLAKLAGVKKIVPGMISWRKKTSAVTSGLYFQRMTDNSIKMAIKTNMYVQDVFVMVDLSFDLRHLRKVVLNPEKL